MHIFNKLLESTRENKCYFCDVALNSKNNLNYIYTCTCEYIFTRDKIYTTIVWHNNEMLYQLIVENYNDYQQMNFGIFEQFSNNHILFLTIPHNIFSVVNEKILTYKNVTIGSNPKHSDMDEFEKIETLEDIYKFSNYLLKKQVFE